MRHCPVMAIFVAHSTKANPAEGSGTHRFGYLLPKQSIKINGD